MSKIKVKRNKKEFELLFTMYGSPLKFKSYKFNVVKVKFCTLHLYLNFSMGNFGNFSLLNRLHRSSLGLCLRLYHFLLEFQTSIYCNSGQISYLSITGGRLVFLGDHVFVPSISTPVDPGETDPCFVVHEFTEDP